MTWHQGEAGEVVAGGRGDEGSWVGMRVIVGVLTGDGGGGVR